MTHRIAGLLSFPFVLLLLVAPQLTAQEVSPTVIASAGGEGTVEGTTIMWTLGEVAVTTLTDGQNVITQGFHQPPEGTTSVPLVAGSAPVLSLRPNPTANELFIDLPEAATEEVTVQLIDLLGQQVGSITSEKGASQVRLDVATIPAGNYIVRVMIQKTQYNGLVTIKR